MEIQDLSHPLTLLKHSSVSLRVNSCLLLYLWIFIALFSATPVNIDFEVVNATAVKVSWANLQLFHLNLSHYTVYYTATKQGRVIDQYRTISSNLSRPSVVVVLRDLMPGLVHQFQVSYSLGTKRRLVEGPRSTNRRFSFGKGLKVQSRKYNNYVTRSSIVTIILFTDDELFQLQIGPVEHCITWQVSHEIKTYVLKAYTHLYAFCLACAAREGRKN